MKHLCFIIFFCVSLFVTYTQDFALKQLEELPRHSEWIRLPNGKWEVRCFVVYPQTSAKTTAVITIHENKGFTNRVRSFANLLANAGYVVIKPDLLPGFYKKYLASTNFESSDAATKAIYTLTVTVDLNAVQA